MDHALIRGRDGRPRCFWCVGDPLYEAYHDQEWGRPALDDRALFEKLCLEAFQAGLSWLTILRKRDGFRRAFAGFEPAVVARFDEAEIGRLLADPAIVRHRGKIEAVIANARAACALIEREGSLATWLWRFAPPADPHRPPRDRAELAQRVQSPESRALAAQLRRRGFRFLGPTNLYAFMQATGLVNDHFVGCWAHEPCAAARARVPAPGEPASATRPGARASADPGGTGAHPTDGNLSRRS